jgi:Carboxypeptidase regulatory-like domain
MLKFGSSKVLRLRKALSLLLAGLLTAGNLVVAGGPFEIRSTDVTLNQDGLLSGTVLNVSAQPVSGVTVRVLHGESIVATSTSNEEGHFHVKGLRHGSHLIQVGGEQHPIRFLGPNTAPPASTAQMAIVIDEQVVRGQAGFAPMYVSNGLNANMGAFLLIGGATAIVLGTTLGANNDSSPLVPASP